MLILDWMLPGFTEAGSIAALRDISPDLIIIALSGRPELGAEAINAGADAFVSKIDPPERLLTTIDRFQSQSDRTPVSTKSE
jgi:CheY-like chemotaxis protein